jgi:spermidine synthase
VAAFCVATGLFAQAAQLVMFREMLAACRGTEVFLGVVLAAGLLWAALGSLAAGLFGRRAARRHGTAWPARAWSYAAALFCLNGLLLIGQIAIARHRSASWGGAAELTFLEAVATAVVATGPVAFLCGAEFVLALHAAGEQEFGTLYQADAWGAVAGGLLFTFLLVGLVDPVTLGPALGAALCLVVLVAGGQRWMPTGLALGLGAAIAVAASGLDARLHAQHWRALLPTYKLRATKDSRYGQLAVLRHPEVEQHSLFMDGGLVESLPPADAPMTDERNQALLALAQHPHPKRVLLVGRALGKLPEALLEHGLEHLDVLELDPALFALADRFHPSRREHPRLRVHFGDARHFIKRQRGAGYDVVLLQLPDPLSAFVNRFYTVEFFHEARAALADRGVLITSVTAAANYAGETVGQLSASILRTLQAVFPEVLVAPGESHTFIAATKTGLASLDPALLSRRVAGRKLRFEEAGDGDRGAYFSALFENLITTSQVASLRETLESTPAPVNTDERPITYQHALLVWNQIVSASTVERDPGVRGGTNALFRAVLRFRFAHGLVLPALVLAPAILLAAVGLLRHGRGARGLRGAAAYGTLLIAFATGLFGMAAEIILVYAFQSTYGYAYAQAGALVAAFMVGLAAGARLGVRWERQPGFVSLVTATMVAYCLTLPFGLRGLAASGASPLIYSAFFVLVFAAGFLDGATFPPLVRSLGGLGFGQPGPWVYAADLAGAGLGALGTGALLVPMLGNTEALLLVALTLAAALVAAAGASALGLRHAS